MSSDNNNHELSSVLATIRERQEQVKLLEVEINDLRYIVSEHIKAHGPVVTDSVKASISETAHVYSYEKDQVDVAITMLSTAVAINKDVLLSEILNVLVKARKESIRPGSLRITFK